MKKKKVIEVGILELSPTQFAVGMLEVDEKIAIASQLSKRKLRKLVSETTIPVVRSPDGKLYIVDHHHFLCVCYHLRIKTVFAEIVADFSRSKMGYEAFWKQMFKTRNAYPFCQFGEGPRKAIYLPRDIRGLADDPYRSIAWFVRKAGAFENSDKNFAEFKWANFFRKKRLLDKTGLAGMPAALEKAVQLSQSKEAKRLPGFEKLSHEEKKETIETARKKGKKLKIRAAKAMLVV